MECSQSDLNNFVGITYKGKIRNIWSQSVNVSEKNLLYIDCGVFWFFFFLKDGKTEKADTSTSSGKASMKSVLENLGELWDQEQYDTEYSLENFMHSLK